MAFKFNPLLGHPFHPVNVAFRKFFGNDPVVGNLNAKEVLQFAPNVPFGGNPIERRFKAIQMFEDQTKETLSKLTAQGFRPQVDEENRLKFDKKTGELLSERQNFTKGFGAPAAAGQRALFSG